MSADKPVLTIEERWHKHRKHMVEHGYTDQQITIAAQSFDVGVEAGKDQSESTIQKDTGGPAFPWGEHGTHRGMTLRDYFAAKAMGLLFRGTCDDITAVPDAIADSCYVMADAMLKARLK